MFVLLKNVYEIKYKRLQIIRYSPIFSSSGEQRGLDSRSGERQGLDSRSEERRGFDSPSGERRDLDSCSDD